MKPWLKGPMMRIAILRVGTVDMDILRKIRSELGETYPETDCLILDDVMPIPSSAYNKERQQFHSSSILAKINKHVKQTQADRVLGVAEVDLYVPPLNFVFGEAMCPGRAAFVSLFRLRPEFYGHPANTELFINRCVKEAVHEIGHTLGLKHCHNLHCVMFFSNTIQMTDRKDSKFCDECWRKVSKALP